MWLGKIQDSALRMLSSSKKPKQEFGDKLSWCWYMKDKGELPSAE